MSFEVTLLPHKPRRVPINTSLLELRRLLQAEGLILESGDLFLDYQLQHGCGVLNQNITLRILPPSRLPGLQQYKRLNCIAVGGFSKVYIVRSLLTGDFFAAKFIQKQDSERTRLVRNELTINQSIDMPFIARMHQFLQTTHFFIFIMEYCPGGELFFLLREIRRMPEEAVRIYFIEVLLALEHLHQRGIVYRDLKPENILLDARGHVRLVDFGLAKLLREKSYSYCGSLEYMAPEVISQTGHSFPADYYCLGALLYELLVGCPPFYEPEQPDRATKARILNQPVSFPQGLSASVQDIIARLLHKDPALRLGALAGIQQIKLHPWVGRFDRQLFLSRKVPIPYPRNMDLLNFDLDDIGAEEEEFTCQIDAEYQRIKKRRRKTSPLKKENSPYYHPTYNRKSVAHRSHSKLVNDLTKTSLKQLLKQQSALTQPKEDFFRRTILKDREHNKWKKEISRLEPQKPYQLLKKGALKKKKMKALPFDNRLTCIS